jgi:hypothetical protein
MRPIGVGDDSSRVNGWCLNFSAGLGPAPTVPLECWPNRVNWLPHAALTPYCAFGCETMDNVVQVAGAMVRAGISNSHRIRYLSVRHTGEDALDLVPIPRGSSTSR